MPDRFAALEQIIADRLTAANPESSYVASLAAKGLPKVAQKVGEEAVETVIAALGESDEALVGEAADLLFHLTLLLKLRGLGLDDVAAELARRHGTSGIAEKSRADAAMSASLPDNWLVTHAEFLAHKSEDRLRHGSFRMKLHTPAMPNVQAPHDQDELYIIVAGHGRFTKSGETRLFGPGDAIFVEAGARHGFDEISDETLLWILFWGPSGGEQESPDADRPDPPL